MDVNRERWLHMCSVAPLSTTNVVPVDDKGGAGESVLQVKVGG